MYKNAQTPLAWLKSRNGKNQKGLLFLMMLNLLLGNVYAVILN